MSDYSGNRGSWAEIYVMLALLATGTLYQGDEFLKKTDAFVRVMEVLRKETGEITRYQRNEDNQVVFIIGATDEKRKVSIPIAEIKGKADILIKAIPKINNIDSRIPDVQNLLEKMQIKSISASGKGDKDGLFNGKNDIVLATLDNSGFHATQGYSIKSRYKTSPPSLFNFSDASKFVFEIEQCSDLEMYYINSILNADEQSIDVYRRIKYIREKFNLKYIGTKQDKKGVSVFSESLENCGRDMETILMYMLLYKWGALNSEETPSDLLQLITLLQENNPMGVRHPEDYYKVRLQEFLYACFSGLTASTYWCGGKNINGGYIEVKSDGEILFYPARSDSQFCKYLINNMICETPDKGSTALQAAATAYSKLGYAVPEGLKERVKNKANKKADYGYVYRQDDKYFLDINFSLRFKSKTYEGQPV